MRPGHLLSHPLKTAILIVTYWEGGQVGRGER